MIIELQKAGHGDSILVQEEDTSILIDGGTASSYALWKKNLDSVSKFNSIFITHIDSDHTNGILKLLQDSQNIEKIIDSNIYFNGVKQIITPDYLSDKDTESCDRKLNAIAVSNSNSECTQDDIGYNEGTSLSFLIDELSLKVNPEIGGKALTRESLPSIKAGEFNIEIIGPDEDTLSEIRDVWIENLHDNNIKKKIINNSYSIAFESYISNINTLLLEYQEISGYIDTNDIEELSSRDDIVDDSLTNKSSISFLLSLNKGKQAKALFLGDAHTKTIEKWLSDKSEIIVDVVKLPHHGSKHNFNSELANRIITTNYLISTNGNIFHHPDKETIAKIVKSSKSESLNFYFNYEIQHICSDFIEHVKSYKEVNFLFNRNRLVL